MKFFIVDVFAASKYQGNPLAVLIPDREINTTEMQQIAKEINFSETAFIMSGKQVDGGYDVRIFSPDVELPFAGHPTLGTAFVISQVYEGGLATNVLLNLSVGQIPVTIDRNELTMKQNQPTFGRIFADSNDVTAMLSLQMSDIDERFPIQVVSTGLPSLIIPVKALAALQKCRVHHERYQTFLDHQIKANVLLFAPGENDPSTQLHVRVFVDESGFFEDPATGSANGNLAAYLLSHQYFGLSKIQYHVVQGVEMGRPSLINVDAELDADKFQLYVGGKVFFVAKGDWE